MRMSLPVAAGRGNGCFETGEAIVVRYSIAFAVFISTSGFAAPGEDHWGSPIAVPESGAYATAQALIEAEQFAEALPILERLAETQPGNANVFNYLGYAHRKTGDLNQSGEAYARALRIDPHHIGALEYQGELFLMRGEVGEAKANLVRLNAICPAGCEEADELAEAIAAHGGGDGG